MRPARNPLEVMSPTMVGALTVLVALVTLYLSYNAGNSLPFVPSYQLAVQVPDAQELSDNNEVLVAGRRVGVIYSIEPRMTEQGHPYAQLDLHLDRSMEGKIHPDATAQVRSRSLLGAKYLDLTLGGHGPALGDGATLPLAQSLVEVEVDDLLDEFTPRTRRNLQRVLGGLGTGLASRGQDFNDTLTALRPLVKDSHAVFGEIAAPSTRLDRLLRTYAATADELAAQPENLAGILQSGAATLSAMDDPALGRSIEKSPGTITTGADALSTLTPVLARARTITARLAPAAKLLPSTAKRLARAGRAGVPALRRAKELAKPLEAAFSQLQGLGADEPSVPALNQLAGVLPQLGPAVDYLSAYQTNCNYIAIAGRNVASTVAEGNASGNWLRFGAVMQPTEMFPTATPAPDLHFDPYPNAGAPGQPHECEAGNEPYLPGRRLGNVPGNQGTKTEQTSPQQTAAVSD
jgi:virulence factor Mce-like protein